MEFASTSMACLGCTGAGLVSPATASAAQALLQRREDVVASVHADGSTSHARLRSQANTQLKPYVEQMATQYNKNTRVQEFKIGQHVGLQIPVGHRGKCDDKYIVCMVVKKHPKNGYKLRCEHGMIQGVIRTDQWSLGVLQSNLISLLMKMSVCGSRWPFLL